MDSQSMEIVLMRHGKPALEVPRLLGAWQVGRFIDAYNAAGVDEQAPAGAIALARHYPLLASSDLPRTRQSAQTLASGARRLVDPLYREAALPYFRRLPLVLPPLLWLVLLRGLWWLGYSGNGESRKEARERAALAAETLIALCREHGRLLLVGHGFSNHFIARELRERGWTGPRKPGQRHWQYTVYRYPANGEGHT